jgi:hypothetical protein
MRACAILAPRRSHSPLVSVTFAAGLVFGAWMPATAPAKTFSASSRNARLTATGPDTIASAGQVSSYRVKLTAKKTLHDVSLYWNRPEGGSGHVHFAVLRSGRPRTRTVRLVWPGPGTKACDHGRLTSGFGRRTTLDLITGRPPHADFLIGDPFTGSLTIAARYADSACPQDAGSPEPAR